MSKSIAVFYTPDDNLEHALRIYPPDYTETGFFVYDINFSPETQGRISPPLLFNAFSAAEPILGITALYSPVDQFRYFFFATSENVVYYSGYPQDICHRLPDPRFGSNGYVPIIDPLEGYSKESIADIASFFSDDDNQVHVVVLMKNGDIYQIIGTPWADDPGWSLIPFLFQRIMGGRRISAYYSPQDKHRHAMIATHQDIVEIYSRHNSTNQRNIAHFDGNIEAISGFYTLDGFQHVAVATLNQTNDRLEHRVNEIFFKTGFQDPTVRILGSVPFYITDIGAYAKPDEGRHVIMLGSLFPSNKPLDQLYLSWYYPGWSGFAYGPWPPLRTQC